MRDRPARAVSALLVASLGLLSGCGGDDEPLTAPPSAAPSSASPSPTPSPSPSPSPSPAPLSAFEDDPAVQGLRAFYVAAAKAVNVDDFAIPELVAQSTASRAEANRETFAEDQGAHVPGPTPFTPLAVQEVAPDRRTVVGCGLGGGWVLDQPGGTPTEPYEVQGASWQMVLEGGVWKVDRITLNKDVQCDGIPLPSGPPA